MKLAIFSAVSTYLPAIEMIAAEIDVSMFVGLSPSQDRSQVAGYMHYADFCEVRGIPFVEVDDYSLNFECAQDQLSAVDFDIVIVLGWQRLIPPWVLNKSRFGFIGVHGSMTGITAGRGRSPLNWAKILGATTFDVSLFFMSEDADDGPVIASGSFAIEFEDAIDDLYIKLASTVADIFVSQWHARKIKRLYANPQLGQSFYLPARVPSDGAVDWSRTDREIISFIRALSRPYPGAFSKIGAGRITIWQARLGECPESSMEAEIGSIISVDEHSNLLVRAGSGLVLLTDYELSVELDVGQIGKMGKVESISFSEQMRSIVQRHQVAYPNRRISPLITREITRTN